MAIVFDGPKNTERFVFKREPDKTQQNNPFGDLLHLENKGSEVFIGGDQQRTDL